MRVLFAAPVLLAAVISAAPVLETRDIVAGEGLPYLWPSFVADHKDTTYPLEIAGTKAIEHPLLLDFSYWDGFKSNVNYGCHATCGVLANMNKAFPNCGDKWMPVFADYCFERNCKVRGYTNANKAYDDCKAQGKTNPLKGASNTPAASSASSMPVETPSSPVAPSQSSVPVASPVTPSVVSESRASTPSQSHSSVAPVGTSSGTPSRFASGTESSSVAQPTLTDLGRVTGGAASTSLSVFAAITVAILAVVVI